MKISDPFTLTAIPPNEPICGRVQELAEVKDFVTNGQNVVLISPRRFGKTTLALHMINELENEYHGFLGVYCTVAPANSPEEVAERIAFAVEKKLNEIGIGISPKFQKRKGPSGFDYLEAVISNFGKLGDELGIDTCIVIDEFQTISLIDETGTIESIMREIIQHSNSSFVFVGSERHMLESMFADKARPFYQSAFRMDLGPLKKEEVIGYLRHVCSMSGGSITEKASELLHDLSSGIPYYMQEIAYFAFSKGGGEIDCDEVGQSFLKVVQLQREDLFDRLKSFTISQRKMLTAIAKEPTSSVYSQGYIKRHNLSSHGAITSSVERLKGKDMIEEKDGFLILVNSFEKHALLENEFEVLSMAMDMISEKALKHGPSFL